MEEKKKLSPSKICSRAQLPLFNGVLMSPLIMKQARVGSAAWIKRLSSNRWRSSCALLLHTLVAFVTMAQWKNLFLSGNCTENITEQVVNRPPGCWFQRVLARLKIFKAPKMRRSLNLGATRDELSFFLSLLLHGEALEMLEAAFLSY